MTNTTPITDPDTAEVIWKSLVRPENVYDEWALRKNFLDSSTFRLHVLTDNIDNPAAMLPLQQKISDHGLQFIGSPFLERNRGYCEASSEEKLIDLYRALPRDTVLDDISGADPVNLGLACKSSDPAYILEHTSIDNLSQDGLYRFLPKNIRENIRKIEKKFSGGFMNAGESSLPFTLENVKRLQAVKYGADSWLESPFIYSAFAAIDKVADSIDGRISCICIESENEVIAGCISMQYQNVFYMLMAGVSGMPSYSGLGSYLHYYCMKYAFDNGCDRIDAGIGDCGWKERWGLQKIPQFKFEFPL